MKRTVIRHSVVQPLDQSIRYIPLTHGQNAIVDAEDYEFLMQWNWLAWKAPKSNAYYATRGQTIGPYKQTVIYMHRVVIGTNAGHVVDHINHNTLDNRKANLRHATPTQSMFNTRKPIDNTSGYKGVSWDKRNRKYTAQIHYAGKKRHLGMFTDPAEGHKAYVAAAKELHGEFYCPD